MFIQLIRCDGPYRFDNDIQIDIFRAPRQAFQVSEALEENILFDDLLRELLFK